MNGSDAGTQRVHAFTDDALGAHDATALAEMLRVGEVSPEELADAAIARAQSVPELHAFAHEAFADPRRSSDPEAEFFGVPSVVKDNAEVLGMPTNHGSEAFVAKPARRDGKYVAQFLATGVTVLGKTSLPEHSLNATTEFKSGPATANPWNLNYSVAGSSGGSAALVAAGVVPIAHGNDGGGSIRMPAAAAGLVGLKPTRGRHREDALTGIMPVRIVSEGVLTRSVRDTANYHAALEAQWRNPALPEIGRVTGPSEQRLRIGLMRVGLDGRPADPETDTVVRRTAEMLTSLGHTVEEVSLPVAENFMDDFMIYWSLIAMFSAKTGRLMGSDFDKAKFDGLTVGLSRHFRQNLRRTRSAIRSLRKAESQCAAMFETVDLVVSPVVGHTTPQLGFLSPSTPFDELLERLRAYVAFTPINNAAGTPALSLPLGMSEAGLPIGVQLHAAYGAERTLLEIAFELESEAGFPTLAG